ncbi:MAG: UDP-N-acetylmuramoyl-tripeptide--D-alanyl-D-alanine ligase [Anaerolineae bacterium]|nr:UDP-N-acetylmuramoyl-tripeptide--D-alanyl-D-alanine ligase [Anaerolineae bacterium]
MDYATLIPILCLFSAPAWLALTTRRVYYLARYFQLEGYESPRFWRWYMRTRRERRFTALNLAVLLLISLPALLPVGLFDPKRSEVALLFLGFTLFFIVALWLRLPRDPQVKQPFKRTPRAMRLLITALLLGAALPVYHHAKLMLSGSDGYAHDLLLLVVVSAVSGMLPILLAPLLLPLANALMFPYEESRRRYFMRKARQTLHDSGATVIVITGSYGKTSTKHYLHHILNGRFRAYMTPKSYNTLMGISRVVNDEFARDPNYDYFIAEADAYFVGENASICRLVAPRLGAVMSVGPMHLERLGSMENIVKAQYEVIEALPPDGVGFFNGDDPYVLAMAERGYPQTRVIISQRGVRGARFEALNVQFCPDGTAFTVRDNLTGAVCEMFMPLYGETNVTNALMAIAIAAHLGMSLEEIAPRVATLQPAEHRLVRHQLPDGTVIIDDAYSANPVGTKAALDVLALHTHSKRRIVVSAGMFELGAQSESANRALGAHMAAAATDIILISSPQTPAVRAGALAAGFPPERLREVANLEQAVAYYRSILQAGDTLLMLTDLPDTYAV